ncbi:substrate-binding domain-containing protein [Enterovibrio sp. ZSDZ35]|uniref:Ribose operon repressor n=1 Tax=Enterovibrio qingdaonensis TaxID=2899818 RepID=A0ABT5QGD0_9GAMM|nr:substrate-binding domain-containing protein [Enterovibrio sp. ZSDZ35]MDD1780038.1 substrate-binding domain-containing protein [Enterovibrio sp. ZSDZ35]
MATMKDIAKLAGVSTSTVSHVINKTRFVSDEIAERVNNAAKELQYYAPSALARSFKTNRTNTFGMIVTTSTNPFFGEVVKGVERSCYHAGYNLILCNTEGDATRMKASIETMMQKRVDGFILMCSTMEGEYSEILEKLKSVPVVVMDWGPISLPCDKIQDNSLRGGYLATKHLIDKGHSAIGCITGPLVKHQAQMRYQGFKRAMKEANLPINPKWVVEGDFECEGGYQAFSAFNKHGELPSAIFAGNDMMAMGLINAANEQGISVPSDLSVMGYDDIHIAKYMTPSLTTVHQPKYRLGKAAVDALIARIGNGEHPPQIVELEPTVMERGSVAKAGASA